MKAYLTAAIGIVLIGAVLGAVFMRSGGSDEQSARAAHAYSFPNYNGEEVSLEDSTGKIRVVNVWASWCPFCVNELPDFFALQRDYPEEVEVVAINRGEPLERAKGFSDTLEGSEVITFLLDREDRYYFSIGGFTMPETLFIDREGEIARHQRGFMTLEQMRAQIEAMLTS